MGERKRPLVPRLRFPEFREMGEWEEKKIGQIADLYKGKGISKSDIVVGGVQPCIRYGELYTLYGEVINNVISKTNISASDLFLSNGNDVIIPASGETKIDIATASCVIHDNIALGGDLNVIRSNQNGIFLSYYLNGTLRNKIAKVAQGDTVVHLYPSQLQLIDLAIPSEQEQQKIADCLSSLDDLISAQNQKVEALKRYKKGLMQQLFPAEGETVPRLRFPEFREMGDWKSKLMGELYSFKGNNSFSRDNLNYDQGTVKNIHYGDIHTKFSPLFDIYKENVPFINSEESIEKIDSENYCLEGDMVFADASEDLADVGKSIELINLNDERVLSGLHTILARQKNTDLIVGFGGHLFQSTSIRNQIRRESQGTKVLSLSATRLAKIQVFYPTRKDEQQKIADCLSSLDDLITLEAKKLEALKTHKKGLMQQLFPREGETVPRLRFPEFREAGKWEYYFGNKLFDQISNTNHNSDLPVLAITQEHGAIPRDMIDYHVSVTKKSLEVYKVVEVGDFIISLRSFQGGIEYSNHHGICSPAYVILRLKSQNVAHYFKYLFKTDRFISQLNKNIEGLRDGKMISYKQFSELRLPVSSFAEQQKIADCLSSLDDLITSQAQKVELLKRHKKGLIQRLFPVLDESQG